MNTARSSCFPAKSPASIATPYFENIQWVGEWVWLQQIPISMLAHAQLLHFWHVSSLSHPSSPLYPWLCFQSHCSNFCSSAFYPCDKMWSTILKKKFFPILCFFHFCCSINFSLNFYLFLILSDLFSPLLLGDYKELNFFFLGWFLLQLIFKICTFSSYSIYLSLSFFGGNRACALYFLINYKFEST